MGAICMSGLDSLYGLGMGVFGLGALMVVLYILFGLVFLAGWILQALGMMEVAKKSPYASKAWMAWVPVCRHYLLGLLVPNPKLGKQTMTSYPLMLAALAVVVIGHYIPVVSSLLPLAFYGLTAFICLDIFKRYRPQSAVLFSIFYPLGFFLIRNQVMGAGRPEQASPEQSSQQSPQ